MGGPTTPPDGRLSEPTQNAAAELRGLDDAEVAQRRSDGRVNRVSSRSSRAVSDIVRANVLTRFNAILGALFVVILIVGPLRDGLFGVVLVANTAIGVVQEVRAKRSLDRLAVLQAPSATVVRAGEQRQVAVADVVVDDLLLVSSGDQIVVDGVIVEEGGLEVDESLLTGESEPTARVAGDAVLSGSFVVAGDGYYRATKVGDDGYAAQLTSEGRRFSLVHSELQAGVNRILQFVTWALLPAAVLLITSQLRAQLDIRDAVRGSVAGVGAMVPEGLVLLTSLALALGAGRLARRGVLVQELPALEGLARVDVVCLDKTGTLTDGDLRLASIEQLRSGPPVEPVLGALVAAEQRPNATMTAVGRSAADPGWHVDEHRPFSSARKWSAAVFAGQGAWVLGAPDVLLTGEADGDVRARVEHHAGAGQRVMLLAEAVDGLDQSGLPASLDPVALVVLDERLRPEAADTLRWFAEQGVTVKVLSGDHPQTVARVAERVGVAGADRPVDARSLPTDETALDAALETGSVFGRVQPEQKRAIVRSLQRTGHVVAMTGDGVNDVMALKDADIGVAMGSGSSACRAVARLVLLDDSFAALPGVVAEGRRVIANVERVANLFVTKTVYAFFLAVAIGVSAQPYPFFPRHLTVISTFTIGTPAFFLALGANSSRFRPGFIRRVLHFTLPAGAVAATTTFVVYVVARHNVGATLAQSRTAATLTLAGVALTVLAILARPATPAKVVLVAVMAAGVATVVVIPGLRSYFALELPDPGLTIGCLAAAIVGGAATDLGWRWVARRQRR